MIPYLFRCALIYLRYVAVAVIVIAEGRIKLRCNAADCLVVSNRIDPSGLIAAVGFEMIEFEKMFYLLSIVIVAVAGSTVVLIFDNLQINVKNSKLYVVSTIHSFLSGVYSLT